MGDFTLIALDEFNLDIFIWQEELKGALSNCSWSYHFVVVFAFVLLLFLR